jgi:hypothetical protein
VFLVDNGWTMSSHWHEACEVFKVLSWRLLGYDEDGMELYFTDPATTIAVLPSPDETSHVLQQAMKMAAPSSQRAHGTDIIPKLAELMNKYAIDQCRDGPQNARKRTIYVLTDGIWEHSTTESVDDFFRYQLKRLQDTYHPPGVPGPLSVDQIRKALKTTRPLTIQFIQFGSDPAATERLRHLDEDFVSGGYM